VTGVVEHLMAAVSASVTKAGTYSHGNAAECLPQQEFGRVRHHSGSEEMPRQNPPQPGEDGCQYYQCHSPELMPTK